MKLISFIDGRDVDIVRFESGSRLLEVGEDEVWISPKVKGKIAPQVDKLQIATLKDDDGNTFRCVCKRGGEVEESF